MILLNIGCGPIKMEGVVNLDNNPDVEPDVLHDLEVTPLPFEDESVHGIIASHVLEHIRNLPELLKELHRILVPGGVLDISVPHYLSPDAWGDLTHVRAFSEQSFFPVFWPGWTIAEYNEVKATKLSTYQECTHLQVRLVKGEEKEEGDDGSN